MSLWSLTDDQIALQQRARELAREVIAPRAAEVDRSEQYPWENVAALQAAGFTGMTVPKELGGPGHSFLDAVLVVEQMAQVCGVTGRIAVEANMGAISAIVEYGTDAQRTLAAELVLSGDKPAICITEPGAGSAASQMTTRADKRGNTYVVNGMKHWITGGGVSKLHLVFARVFDEDGSELGIGGFIAIRDETPGLRIGTREPTMGLRGIPETQVIFEDMAIDESMVLMPPSGFAKGFADLMNAYNAQRVGAGTVALGIATGANELAVEFAKQRQQFDRPIAEFQGLQWMLADMSVKLEAARSLTYRAACSRGAGSAFPDPTLAAQAKLFTSESAIQIVNDALQVHGAAGYSRNNPLERMYRDVRMFTIGGGTAQILRTVVAGRVLGMRLPQTRDGYVAAKATPAAPAAQPEQILDLFVYGTLQPGDVRWPFLEPYVVDGGEVDATTGSLYDTGCDYPAAIFDGARRIEGRRFRLHSATVDEALAELDEVEAAVDGLFRRVAISTESGAQAWAYEYGDGLTLTPIDHGNWLHHIGLALE